MAKKKLSDEARPQTVAVEVLLSLAGTNTSSKPLAKDLDGSGKIVFEFDSSQSRAIDEVMSLGYDKGEQMAWELRVLVERGDRNVTKKKEPKGSKKQTVEEKPEV